MDEKRAVDLPGAAALIGFAALLAFNQVVIKVTGGGFGPVFQAGLRSVLAAITIYLYMRVRGIPVAYPSGAFGWGLLSGTIFAFEFICLFVALDLAPVSRVSILFYTMPVWLALAAHVLLPGERLTGPRAMGLVLAMAGVVLALSAPQAGTVSRWGDILSILGAMGWASIALLVRMSPLSKVGPETQMLFQVIPSALWLLALAPLFGALLRDPGWIHVGGLLFQAVCVVSLGFLAWFALLKIYRASDVASFSFLSPVFAVVFGWMMLGEEVGLKIWLALGLVAAGIFLINRK